MSDCVGITERHEIKTRDLQSTDYLSTPTVFHNPCPQHQFALLLDDDAPV